MKRFLKLYSVEQKLFFRSGDVFIFNLCMPLVVMILIAVIAGSKIASENMTYMQSAYTSLITVGICCSAFMSIPIVMVDYRDKKILKSFYCSPASPATLLGADVLCSAVMSAISAVILTLVAVVVFGYRMSGNAFAFAGSWLLTLVSMFSIGLLIASFCRTAKSMNVATSAVYFPMLLFSGATIPYELFPKAMQRIADFMPLSVGIKLMKNVSLGIYEGTLPSVIILSAIAVVCIIISIKSFRWE